MIRVIIEREIAPGLEQFYQAAIADLLDVMASAPGYLAGESLAEIHRPNHYVVVTRWTNEAAWNRWFHSPERQQMLNTIRPFLQRDEKITLLQQLIYQRDEKSA